MSLQVFYPLHTLQLQALGGLFAFALFTLYPTFMGYMAGIFKDVMFIYAILFFGETFCLYLYYYGWDWLSEEAKGKGQKAKGIYLATKAAGGIIIFIGILFLLGFGGPHMRGDTRAFIALLLILPIGAGLFILKDRKSLHIFIGILLNVFGIAIMFTANSWAGFMMAPYWRYREG